MEQLKNNNTYELLAGNRLAFLPAPATAGLPNSQAVNRSAGLLWHRAASELLDLGGINDRHGSLSRDHLG
nr:hypothetical protein [Bordetella hinzii]